MFFIALLSLTCIEGFLFRPLKSHRESEFDNCNKNKNLNMRYTQRNVMIGERDIMCADDQQNQYMSNQGNSFINFISRALTVIEKGVYIYRICDCIFLSTVTDEIYYGDHESSEKYKNDLKTEENEVFHYNYQRIDILYRKIGS